MIQFLRPYVAGLLLVGCFGVQAQTAEPEKPTDLQVMLRALFYQKCLETKELRLDKVFEQMVPGIPTTDINNRICSCSANLFVKNKAIEPILAQVSTSKELSAKDSLLVKERFVSSMFYCVAFIMDATTDDHLKTMSAQ